LDRRSFLKGLAAVAAAPVAVVMSRGAKASFEAKGAPVPENAQVAAHGSVVPPIGEQQAVRVYLNGLVLRPGEAHDYSIVDGKVQFHVWTHDADVLCVETYADGHPVHYWSTIGEMTGGLRTA